MSATSKYGLKQGAYGTGTLVSTTRSREGVSKDTTKRYTIQFKYTPMGSSVPCYIFVTPKEDTYLRTMALRRSISYVWRDATGKLEIQ